MAYQFMALEEIEPGTKVVNWAQDGVIKVTPYKNSQGEIGCISYTLDGQKTEVYYIKPYYPVRIDKRLCRSIMEEYRRKTGLEKQDIEITL